MTNVYIYKNGTYEEVLNVAQGLTIDKAIDDTLDTATIITYSNQDFKIYDSVKIVSDNTTKCFLIADINVEKKPSTAITKKTLSLIEPTKYLEKIIVNGFHSTNKTITLREQVERLLNNVENLIVGDSSRFTLSLATKSLLAVKGEDLFFDKRTLRECLDEAFSIVNARCEVLEITDFSNIVITHYKVIDDSTSVNLTTAQKDEQVQNVEYLGTNIETSIVNAFTGDRDTIYHPSKKSYTTFKTKEAVLTSSNATIQTAFPIEEIRGFIVKLNVNVSYLIPSGGGAEDTTNFTLDFDIMRNVVDLETWNLLETASTSKETAYIKSTNFFKQNTINYTRGSSDLRSAITKIIFGAVSTFRVAAASALLHTTTYVLDTINALHQGEPREINIDDITHITTANLDYNSAVFRIEYIPYIDAHAKIGKDNYSLVDSTIINSQTDKIVDLKRLGVMLKNNINRFGNEDIHLDLTYTSLDNVLNEGQVVNTNYIISKVSVALFDNYVRARYTITKNYPQINQKIGIDRKRQIYNIPLENQKVDNLIKIKVKALKTSVSPNGFLELLKNALYTLRPSKINEPINIALVRTEFTTAYVNDDVPITALSPLEISDGVAYEYLSELLEMPVVDYQIANSCLFTFSFEDNFSAGMSSVGRVVGGIRQIPNPYVNPASGEYYQVHLRLFNDNNVVNRPTTHASLKEFPKTDESYYVGTVEKPVVFPINECFNKIKDRIEHISFTTQVEFASDDEDIIITEKFAELNSLINFDKASLKVYSSTSLLYQKFDTKGKGTTTEISINDFIYTETSSEVSLRLPSGLAKLSWAITDLDDNILIAFNNRNLTFARLYFTANYER